ncbi:MAG: HipA domain-containing protein [Hydrogenophaga sp.]|nr:HipA domain-containing protein [Hydrogenophaga sp.]
MIAALKSEYVPHLAAQASLDELLEAAELIEKGSPPTPALDPILNHDTSIGGARPKALINDGTKKFIAKFSASNDTYSVVKAEFIAMKLASACGLNAPSVSMTHAACKDVLLIERFDRTRTQAGWARRAMVSALTMLGLDEMLTLTPAYDICPQNRTRNETTQAMLIKGGGRASTLKTCLAAAPDFHLKEVKAAALIERQITAIAEHWQEVCY